VGVVVGLTGMGGGALMTPVLIMFFGVPPLAAVSSDVVASFFMKPIGGLVHLRRGTVHLGLVRWLCVGSVPGAFCGVLVLRALGSGERVAEVLLVVMGAVLVVASVGMVAKAYLHLLHRQRARRAGRQAEPEQPIATVSVRPAITALIGAGGGIVVGMTSVGAGSLMIVALLLLYPSLKAGQLVGTDLVQAVPLVAAASVGHVLFGDFALGLTGSVLVGAVPGVWLGARLSSRSRGGLVRRALAVVLLASGLKLLGAPTGAVLVTVGAAVVGGSLAWAWFRTRLGEPPRNWQRRLRRPLRPRLPEPPLPR
jgi:uncharacterized protein